MMLEIMRCSACLIFWQRLIPSTTTFWSSAWRGLMVFVRLHLTGFDLIYSMADCPNCENSRCLGRCRVLPIVYPISQMWRFDYEHNYIKVAQLRPPDTKMVISSINWAQGNRIMPSSSFYDFA